MIKDFFARLLNSMVSFFLGREREKRKQQERARDLEKQMHAIGDRPDLSRDELYNRLRNRDRGVSSVSRPTDRDSRDDV